MTRLLLIAALLLAGCGSLDARTAGGDAGGSRSALAGRTFWSTDVEGHDLVPGTRAQLTFQRDGTLGVTAGCNSMGGRWSLDGDALEAEVTAMTEMGCEEARMTQDEWISQWLAGGLTATVEGDRLTLAGGGVTMVLVDRKVADPDRPLVGTTWVVDGLVSESGGAVSSIPDGIRASLRINAGVLQVNTGCNEGQAPVEVDGDTLRVGSLVLTRRACGPAAAEVERAMTRVLAGAVTATIDGGSLQLAGAKGGLLLRAA